MQDILEAEHVVKIFLLCEVYLRLGEFRMKTRIAIWAGKMAGTLDPGRRTQLKAEIVKACNSSAPVVDTAVGSAGTEGRTGALQHAGVGHLD